MENQVLKPCLIHEDYGDCGTHFDSGTGEVFIFATCSFCSYNEYTQETGKLPDTALVTRLIYVRTSDNALARSLPRTGIHGMDLEHWQRHIRISLSATSKQKFQVDLNPGLPGCQISIVDEDMIDICMTCPQDLEIDTRNLGLRNMCLNDKQNQRSLRWRIDAVGESGREKDQHKVRILANLKHLACRSPYLISKKKMRISADSSCQKSSAWTLFPCF